jgi:hypothetical protein
MSILLIIFISFIVIIGILSLIFYLRYVIPLRGKEEGFKYVYVEKDGRVRELNKDEEAYLTKEFFPTDGARPYIKDRYWQRAADNKLDGYILRRRVPKNIEIQKNLNH